MIGVEAEAATSPGASQTFGDWIRISPDNTITLMTNVSEMGQGARTGLARAAADELDADWSRVTIEPAPIEPAYFSVWKIYLTGGSASVFTQIEKLRKAGAGARLLLRTAAAQQWGAPLESCTTSAGYVIHEPTGRKVSYGSLAQAASKLRLEVDPPLKTPDQWTLIGKDPPPGEAWPKVTGKTVYGIDFKLPGMRSAAIRHCPQFGGRLQSVDPAPALAQKALKVVELPSAVAVIAADWWTAWKAVQSLEPRWSETSAKPLSQQDLNAALAAPLQRREGGEPSWPAIDAGGREALAAADKALASATQVVDATYEAQMLSQAPLEPMNFTARVGKNGVELWGPTQGQSTVVTDVAKALGLPESAIELQTTALGGGFGRRLASDYAVEAALIAKAMPGVPVKLIWSRDEDLRGGAYRPASRVRMRAGLHDGKVLGARADIACMSDLGTSGLWDEPYAVPAKAQVFTQINHPIPMGAYRAVDKSQNTFILESFIDEIAHALRRDPLAVRLEWLEQEPRGRRVLAEAASRAGWGRALSPGVGLGIAFSKGWRSYCAQVAQVRLEGARLRVEKVICVLDCGFAVTPDRVRAQCEGGVMMGLSAALGEAITIAQGAAEQSDFAAYPILRISQAPQIEVTLLNDPANRAGGVGEVALPPIAPAVVNAIYAATGRRVRSLPLSAQGFEVA